jgi:hypothetical protein
VREASVVAFVLGVISTWLSLDQRHQSPLRITVTVDVSFGRMDESMTRQQLHVAQ